MGDWHEECEAPELGGGMGAVRFVATSRFRSSIQWRVDDDPVQALVG